MSRKKRVKIPKFIVLILAVFVISFSIGNVYASDYSNLEREAYRTGENIGGFLSKVLLWFILVFIALIIVFIIILRAVLSIGTRVTQLNVIKDQLAELYTLSNDIRILLTSIDCSINNKKTKSK